MNKMKQFLAIAILWCATQTIHAQLNIAGFGATHGIFNASDVNINNSLSGGHAFIETPLANYSFRGDLTYLVRLGEKDAGKSNIDNLLSIRIGYGVLLRKEQRLQIPVFVSGSYHSSNGDLKLKSYGLGLRGGVRYFLTQRFGLYLDANADYIFGKKVKYTNLLGVEIERDLNPINTQINIGILYLYIKSK